MKRNCWEYKECGREPGGTRAQELGVCPAATETRLDGSNNGKNGGRACWVATGTLCEGKVQGTFARKYKSCFECDFYKVVQGEEYPAFQLTPVLLAKLREK